MALVPKIGIINYDDTIVITDNTGDYNAVSNPGGWGSPNTSHGSVTAINLDIYLPSSVSSVGTSNLITTTFFTSSDRAYDIFKDVSTVVPSFALQDGVWKYVINFVGSGSQPITHYSLRTNAIKCQIAKLALGDMDLNNFEEMKLLYDKMVQAFSCEDYTLAQSLYEDIQFALTDCGSGYSYSSCGC